FSRSGRSGKGCWRRWAPDQGLGVGGWGLVFPKPPPPTPQPRVASGPSTRRKGPPPRRARPPLPKAPPRDPRRGRWPRGTRVVFRERGVVKAIGRLREVRPVPSTWKLRQPLKGTAIYENRAFWSELKPPRGVSLPPIHGALVAFDHLVRFEKLPSLGLGAITR